MIDEIIAKVGAAIKGAFLGVVSLNWIPELAIWYWWLFVLFLACGAVIYFFGWSRTVRIVASMALLFGGVFVAGGHLMKRRMDVRDARMPPQKPAAPPRPDDRPFGGWR